MNSIIETLKSALQKEGDILSSLEDADENCWQVHYPVAVVHEDRRVKEADISASLQENDFLDAEGYTPMHWSSESIEVIEKLAPKYVKHVSILVHKGTEHRSFTFQEKRPKDYWKKVVDDGSFKATVEHSVYGEGTELCSIESDLRDLMRSSKEVPALKEIGFIWLVEAPLTLEMDRILAHYYQKNWMMVITEQKTVYIGWHPRLGSIDMRHFVCPPNTKKEK